MADPRSNAVLSDEAWARIGDACGVAFVVLGIRRPPILIAGAPRVTPGLIQR